MGWKDLLDAQTEERVFPWLGERSITTMGCSYQIDGPIPPEPGWCRFEVLSKRQTTGRKLRYLGPSDPPSGMPIVNRGYLVGDRIVRDTATAVVHPAMVSKKYERVHLIEDGLDRFAHVRVGRLAPEEPLVYIGQEFPLGPEDAVLQAYLDELPSVSGIQGVTPALDAAFQMETWQRAEAARRRAEAERLRREEEERRALAERRQKLVEQLGDAQGRRAMAQHDFGEAAKAALAVGGATYLDHRRAVRPNEMAVRFRFLNRRFECTCDARTLQIIDAGICLVAHHDDDDFAEGTRGDALFSLESLPSVIRQADREHRLVVFRHVG